MTHTKKERQYYNTYRERVCNNLGITVNQYNWLRRKGEELRKVYENKCNGSYNTEVEYNVLTNGIENKIEGYINGLHVHYQTDPRGASLYLDNKPIPENSYTNANCIY